MGRQTQATARRAEGDPPCPTEPQVDGPAEAAQARPADLTPGRQPGADRPAEHLGSRLAQRRPAAPECDCHPWHPGWDAVSLIGSRPGAGNLDVCGQPALASAVGISWTSELLTVTGLDHAEVESEAGLSQHLW